MKNSRNFQFILKQPQYPVFNLHKTTLFLNLVMFQLLLDF